MPLPALTVPISADDTALRAAFDRAKAAVSGFSATGQGDLSAFEQRAVAMAGNLREKLDFSHVVGASGKSARDSASAFEELLREQEAVMRSAASLRAQLDPLGAAQQKLNATMAEHAKLAAAGAITTREEAAANSMAHAAFQRSTVAANDNKRAVGLAGYEWKNLGLQANDAATMLLSGSSAFQVVATQGGQVFQVLQGANGGVGAALRSVGSAAVGLLSPFNLAVGAVAAFGGAAYLATTHYRALQEQMNRSVSGVGRASGLSGAGLDDLAVRGAPGAGLGLSAARDNAMALSRTGKLDASNISGVLGLTRGYAGAFGTSYGEAGTQLADIFSDPAKGAEKLNERLGFLDDRTRQYIKTLQAQGDQQGAVRVAVQASTAALNEQVRPQGPLDRFMTFWGGRNAQIEAGIASTFSGSTPQQEYNLLSSNSGFGLSNIMASRRPGGRANDIAEDQRNNSLLNGSSPLMRSQQADVIANQQSQMGGDIVRSILPDVERLQALIAQRDSLQKAIDNPDALKRMGVTAEQAYDALDRLNTGISNFKTNAEQVAAQSTLTLASIQAETFAEKQAAEYQKNYADALDRTNSKIDAAVSAEAKRNEAIATANKQAEEAARAQRQSDDLLGLRPAQRIEAEYRQALDNGGREYGAGRASAASLSGGAAASINRTLGFEGGLNRADTNGTPSNFGINQAAYPGLDVTKLSAGGATAIYKRDYWDKIGADSMSPEMARVAFDTAVMEGVGRAMKLVSKSGGDANKLLDLRQEFEGGLLAKDPAKYGPYAKAWASRNASLRADISGAGQAGGFVGGIPGSYGVANTAEAASASSALDHRNAQFGELVEAPFRAANDNLKEQVAAQRVAEQAAGLDTYGRAAAGAAGKIAEMNERLSLQNELTRAGVKDLAPFQSRIDEVAAKYGEAAKAAAEFDERQRQVVQAMDEVRGVSRDALGTFVDDLIHGKSAGTAFRDVLSGIGQKMLSMGEDMLIGSLFGKNGSAGGGLFGNLLGGLFSGMPKFANGTDDAPGGPSLVGERGPEIVNLPRGAQVIPNGAGFGRSAPQISLGDTHLHVASDVPDKTISTMRQMLVHHRQETLREVTRNLSAISSANQQYAA